MRSRRNWYYNREILESLYQRQLILSPFGKDLVCDKGYNFQMKYDGTDVKPFQFTPPKKNPRPTGLCLFEWEDFMVDGTGRLFYKQTILLPEPPEKVWCLGQMIISKSAVRLLQKDPIMAEEIKEQARIRQANLPKNHKYFSITTRMKKGGDPIDRWVVGKVHANTYILSQSPFVHGTEESARAEAIRLKKIHSQDEFHILRASKTSSREVVFGQEFRP